MVKIMALKDELYAVNQGKTFAENIDRAWDIFSDKDQTEADRGVAQAFLIYAFDLQIVNDINGQLLSLMKKRNKYKADNPEYIPGLSPKNLKLKPKEMLPNKTDEFQKTEDSNLSHLFKTQEMLDVVEDGKEDDITYSTQFFTSKERAQRRVHIYQGKFYQQGALFDTKNLESHSKVGYAAFTLNANGELSVFTHRNLEDKIAHSSMNAGSPVVCAGELIITNGELVTINTHSGHYAPSLFNMFRALEYFGERGVNISQTNVHTICDPADYGLEVSSSKKTVNRTDSFSPYSFFEIPGATFFTSMKEKLNQSLLSIQHDTQRYQSTSLKNILFAMKDCIRGSTLTHERKAIALKVGAVANDILSQLTSDDGENSQKLEILIEKLEALKAENMELSRNYKKSEDSGRLFRKIDSFLQQAQAIPEIKTRVLDKSTVESMKSFF